jgi:hypothetical protein
MVGAQQPERVGDVIARLFSRGDLPETVAVRRRWTAGVPVGSVWRWDVEAAAYACSAVPGYVLAHVVRRGWGVFFSPGPAPSTEGVQCLLW